MKDEYDQVLQVTDGLLAEHNPEAAAYEIAKSEVEAMGYHRRDRELAALAAVLGGG
jgi:uncharacterized membrane protein YukC